LQRKALIDLWKIDLLNGFDGSGFSPGNASCSTRMLPLPAKCLKFETESGKTCAPEKTAEITNQAFSKTEET